MKLSKELNFVCSATTPAKASCEKNSTASETSWLDAHFECKDKNAKLAELYKYSDRLLRKYLVQRGTTRGNIWIGGMFDWSKNRWSWGYNGRDMAYQSFSQMKPGEDLKYHCSVLNPELKYRWSAKLCFEKNYYLCQHRMPYVSEKNRHRIYARWNETFPGQKANEIQVYVKPNGGAGNRRELNRGSNVILKRPTSAPQRTPNRSRDQSESNQIPVDNKRRRLNNEINPPEVLSTQDTRSRRKKQHNKSKEREAVKLSGNVDLGMSKKSLRTRSKSSTTSTPTTTTEHPNEIPRNFQPQSPSSNHHRHNHYNADYDRQIMTSTTTQYPISYQSQSLPALPTPHRTQTPIKNMPITSIPLSTKHIEKKKRLESIREKLASLSDAEKIEFMRLKALKKAERSKSTNETTS